MSEREVWHRKGLFILTENDTFLARGFSIQDTADIVREHNAFGDLLAACKAAREILVAGMYPLTVTELDKAIAKAEGREP